MTGTLGGRIALVTGGGNGIGRAITLTLVRHGATVVLTDRDAAGMAETVALAMQDGGSAQSHLHDVTDTGETNRIVASVVAEHGRLDILVNNAGVSKGAPFLEIDEAEWDRVNDINAKAVFLTSRAVAPQMIAQQYGKIVNISSVAGKEATPLFLHYSASKFAVMAITQGLAKELAPHAINVNAVCPGIVRTPLWEPLLDQLAATQSISRGAAFDRFTDQIPLHRPQEPEDIGEAVAFLASDLAKNITGQGLNVCGGMQLH